MKAWIISGVAVVALVVAAVVWGYHMEAVAAQQRAELQHVAAQQTAAAVRQTLTAQQTATAVAQQTATAVAQQTATAVAQQTAEAEAQQTAMASVHQTAVAQQTAAARQTATAVAVNAAVQQTATARQMATAVAQDTAVAQQTANAAVQQTVVAQQVAKAEAQQTAVAQQTAAAQQVSYASAGVQHTYTNEYELSPSYYDTENFGTPNDSWPVLVPGSVMNIHVEVDGGDGKVRLTAYDGGTGAKLYKWGIQQAPFDASAIVPSSGALIFDVSNDFNPVDSKSVTITYTFQTTS